MSWSEVTLAFICRFIRNGASIKQTKNGDGLPITRIETIADRVVNLEKCGYANLDQSEYLDYRLANGDILISHINSEKHLGKCALFELERNDVVHGMNLLCLRPDQTKVFPKFLFYVLNSQKFTSQIPQITKKSVNQASFTVTAFKELLIPFPPIEEQKRIAAILDKADAIRRKRQQAIQLADDFLRAVFLDMFGDPNEVQGEWHLSSLGDLGGNVNNKRVPLKQSDRDSRPGKYLYYGATGAIDTIDDFLFDGEHLLIAEDGKNLINRTKPLAFPASGKFWVNNHAHVIKYTGSIELKYLEYYLNLKDIRSYVTGIDQFKLNKANLDSIEVSVPPKTLQCKFSEIVQQVTKIQSKKHSSSESAESMFNSLSQKAFAGEL